MTPRQRPSKHLRHPWRDPPTGVARSRSDALAWCVRLVRTHEGEWIDELRDALVHVEAVRARGPGGDTPDS